MNPGMLEVRGWSSFWMACWFITHINTLNCTCRNQKPRRNLIQILQEHVEKIWTDSSTRSGWKPWNCQRFLLCWVTGWIRGYSAGHMYRKEQERCINEDCAQREAVGYTQHRLALAAYWFRLVFAGQDGYCIGQCCFIQQGKWKTI